MLVTGGTGSFGHQIVDRLLEDGPAEIRVFSRDEDKQVRMSEAECHVWEAVQTNVIGAQNVIQAALSITEQCSWKKPGECSAIKSEP